MGLGGLQGITAGYRERMRRLALFDPIYDLDRKRETDEEGTKIDLKGLGLLTLLFFFEKKIIRDTRTGAVELAGYLQDLSREQYSLSPERYEKIAHTIIQTFRPSTGKRRTYDFFNWETMQSEEMEYSILKDNNFDAKSNQQYYTLDEDGLELVFATKEFYSEFQLSINQLMLRKQLEKGEFDGALKQINEMRLNVESLYERMEKLRHEIQRNIVSEETFERYQQLIEDSHLRLARENEEFNELRQFVQETQDRLAEKDFQKKERAAYTSILKVNKNLEEVHYEHAKLLDQSMDLKNHTLRAAQESLYYTGIDAFNFDQDILSRIIGTPLPLESMKGILNPFLKVHEEKQWSPLTVFAEQNIQEERQKVNDDHFVDVSDEEDESQHAKKVKEAYGMIMTMLMDALEDGCHDLRTVMDWIDEQGQSDWFQKRHFYDFWILLHQRSPIEKGGLSEGGNHVLDSALNVLGNHTLKISDKPQDVLKVTERFAIQNMDISVEGGVTHALSGTESDGSL